MSMKNFLIMLLAAVLLLPAAAQESGIHFFHGTWEEGVEKAKQERKKIFIDFFTEWCGPCLNMSLKVFPLPEVGAAYNKDFVCMKIDAEKGEGVKLAAKYGVHYYPSYIFVDPATERLIHRSGGNKPAADFVADTRGALDPKYSSIYLTEKYTSDDYDVDFLMDYIRGQKVQGNRNLDGDFAKLIGMGCKLTDRKVWNLYRECITGYDNPYVRQVSDNYDEFVSLFGKKEVDTKLADATRYAPATFTQGLHDFEGKYHNQRMARMGELFRNESRPDLAWDYVDTLLADTLMNQRQLVDQLAFYTRVSPDYKDKDLSFEQLARKVAYTRYVAYNKYDRDDAAAHYNYAVALEYLMKRAVMEKKAVPIVLIAAPVHGKTVYDLRHPQLKSKPKRSKNKDMRPAP